MVNSQKHTVDSVVPSPDAARTTNEPCASDEGVRPAVVHFTRTAVLISRPQIRRDYPLNLSISISGGKETNEDSLSNGE